MHANAVWYSVKNTSVVSDLRCTIGSINVWPSDPRGSVRRRDDASRRRRLRSSSGTLAPIILYPMQARWASCTRGSCWLTYGVVVIKIQTLKVIQICNHKIIIPRASRISPGTLSQHVVLMVRKHLTDSTIVTFSLFLAMKLYPASPMMWCVRWPIVGSIIVIFVHIVPVIIQLSVENQ